MRVTALACLILATIAVPLAAADLPASCDLSSVMPPSKNTQAFENALILFIGARWYEKLGWTNDPLEIGRAHV